MPFEWTQCIESCLLHVIHFSDFNRSKMPTDKHQKPDTQALVEYQKEQSKLKRQKYDSDPKKCRFCGTVIGYEKRRNDFCSKSCGASYNNAGVTRHIKGSKVCSCGNPKLPQNKYCSACSQSHFYHKSSSVETVKLDGTRKKLLVEMRGYRCEVCGLSEWMGKPIPIELHHIDGNTDHNKESNLQLLCSNCHGQTETHRRRNKMGKRQLMRRKRYSDGKTW